MLTIVARRVARPGRSELMVDSVIRPWWAIVGVGIVAVILAGATTALAYSAHLITIQDDAMTQSAGRIAVVLAAFVISTPLIAAGLIVWGLPVWLVLRKLHLDSIANSALAGSLSSLLVVVAWYGVSYSGEPLTLSVQTASLLPLCVLPGAVCAWVVRRFAYRRARSPAERKSREDNLTS